MRKRWTAEQIQRLLRDIERDRTKGLTVTDCCRQHGISETVYYRWQRRLASAGTDDSRRLRELQSEVERLKRLVAEWMLDKQMLQDITPKKW